MVQHSSTSNSGSYCKLSNGVPKHAQSTSSNITPLHSNSSRAVTGPAVRRIQAPRAEAVLFNWGCANVNWNGTQFSSLVCCRWTAALSICRCHLLFRWRRGANLQFRTTHPHLTGLLQAQAVIETLKQEGRRQPIYPGLEVQNQTTAPQTFALLFSVWKHCFPLVASLALIWRVAIKMENEPENTGRMLTSQLCHCCLYHSDLR